MADNLYHERTITTVIWFSYNLLWLVMYDQIKRVGIVARPHTGGSDDDDGDGYNMVSYCGKASKGL